MRIIENEDARRYAFEATLYDFTDLDRKVLSDNVHVEIENPVPVYAATSKLVGYATVFLDRGAQKLRAVAFIDYATPERLSIETEESIYALPEGDFSVSAKTGVVDGVWVPAIELGRRPAFKGIGGRCRPPNNFEFANT